MLDNTHRPHRLEIGVAPAALTLGARLSGFGAGTLIDSACGVIPVESLLAGDELLTVDGGRAILRGMHVVTLHDALAVVIDPSVTRPDLPATSFVIGPGQAIARPEALAGGVITLRPADHPRLIHDIPGARAVRVPMLRLYQLHCDRAVTIATHGLHALLPAISMDRAPQPPLH